MKTSRALLCYCWLATIQTPYAQTSSMLLKSRNYQGCIEPKDFDTSNGDKVFLERCDTDKGGWYMEQPDNEGPYMFKSRANLSKCLQSGFGRDIQDGTKLRLLDCGTSNPFQRFLWDSFPDGPIKAAFRGNFCVVFRGEHANVGRDPIIIKHCDAIREKRQPWEASFAGGDTPYEPPKLFAKYDWQQGAKDVSGVMPLYDGELEEGVSASDGTLSVFDDQGVRLGYLSELDGAASVLFRFEQVTFRNPFGYSVLLGGGYEQWWVGIYRDIAEWTTEPETNLIFNVGGWGSRVREYEHKVQLEDPYSSSFDSIEYLFNASAVPTQRLAIRYNDGNWFHGGESRLALDFPAFPVARPDKSEYVKINDGARADWDHWNGTLGTVSLWASTDAV